MFGETLILFGWWGLARFAQFLALDNKIRVSKSVCQRSAVGGQLVSGSESGGSTKTTTEILRVAQNDGLEGNDGLGG